MSSLSDTQASNGDAIPNSNDSATQCEHENDGIRLPTALERIDTQHTSNSGVVVCITLDQWLQRRSMLLTKSDDTGGSSEGVAWFQNKGKRAPTANCHEGDLQERLRVAIATTKALNNVRDGSIHHGHGDHFFPLSLSNAVLKISDSCCDVTLLEILGDDNNILSGIRASDDALKQLGYILNAIFGGSTASDMGMQAKQDEEDCQPTKKTKGKSEQVGENLPSYLACLISSLISTTDNSEETIGRYESVKQVMGDLQMAAKKPHVYLKKSSWEGAKMNHLRVLQNSFYGRKSELSLLFHSLDTVLRFGKPVVVSVSGCAGAGKSALLNQIEGPLRDAEGFMIRGKFDKKSSSNTVLFSALDDFFGLVSGSAAAARLQVSIRDTVGCGLGVLMRAIPNLRVFMEGYLCNEEDKYGIDESAVSHQRWKFLLPKLMNAISNQSHPIVFCLDDLHWCDDETLDVIQTVLMDPDLDRCLFLGSYRINDLEVSVPKMLNSLTHAGVYQVPIRLSSIETESVNLVVSELLSIPPCLSHPLSTVVHSKTGGLILFVIDFLKALHEECMIMFNLNTCKWQYNVDAIRKMEIPKDVVQHLSHRILRLPTNIQSLLKVAACLGFKFDVDILHLAIKGSQVPLADLIPYTIEGGFLRESPDKHKLIWAHDQIHLAAYELIPLRKQPLAHLLAGSRIFMNITSDEQLEKAILIMVNNINMGLEFVTTRSQRDEVSQLNLTAGKKAAKSSSFSSAAAYFMTGIRLLADDCWDKKYKLSLTLHQAASKVFFNSGIFSTLKISIDEQLCHAKCLDDKLPAYDCLVRYLHSHGKVREAMEKTISILSELGETFPSPSEVTPQLIYKELLATNYQKVLTKQRLFYTRRCTDERKLWKMRFMGCLLKFLFSTEPIVIPLVAIRMVSLDDGYCSDSSMGYLAYSHSIFNIVQDVDVAYQWAKIALCFPSRFGASLLPKLNSHFHTFISFLKEPLQATCDELLSSHQDLVMLGDVESAVTAIFNHCRQCLFSGKELTATEAVCSRATAMMAHLNQKTGLLTNSSHHHILLKLIGEAGVEHNPFGTLDEAFNELINSEDDILQYALSTGKTGVVQGVRFNKLFLAYWFKEYREAAEVAELYASCLMMPLIDIQFSFYSGLTAYHFARYLPNEPRWVAIGGKALSSFKYWKSHSTWNWENKFFLLEAECHFSKGETEKARLNYRLAIESARKHKFVHEEGLANELCSTFHATIGNADKAKSHISEARACYQKWGAYALIDQLDSLEGP